MDWCARKLVPAEARQIPRIDISHHRRVRVLSYPRYAYAITQLTSPPPRTSSTYYHRNIHAFQRNRPFRTFTTTAPTIRSTSRAGHSSPTTNHYNGTLYLCFGGGGQQSAKCATTRCRLGMVRSSIDLQPLQDSSLRYAIAIALTLAHDSRRQQMC
jgi:hypothetical protein